MSKTIEIKKIHIRNLILSFILGFVILYALEHKGDFTFKLDYVPQQDYGKPSLTYEVPVTTKVRYITFHTYFDNEFTTDGNGFNGYDMTYSDGEFKKYSVKSYYYTKGTIKDFKYGIYISLGIFLITLFFTNFKIKLA